MEIIPNAKMVEIKIVEVPYGWLGFASKNETSEPENHNFINLIHTPSGTKYTYKAPEKVNNSSEAAEYRAKAKITFIHELHGESWLNE
jgi:hypothetical protein